MDSHEAAYLAGFFDGEGCVGAYMRGDKVVLRLAVGNTHRPSLDRIQRAFGGSTCPINQKKRPRNKPQWQWSITGQRAKDALAVMLPYLLTKKAQAEIALTWPLVEQRRRTALGTFVNEPVTIGAQHGIRAQLMVLNKRGAA